MNIKKNNGYVGVDVSSAIIILLLLIPTITGMIYNMNKNNKNTLRKAEAINIAVNALESAKCIDMTQSENFLEDSLKKLESVVNCSSKKIYADQGYAVFVINNESYKLKLDVKDYAEKNSEALSNVVKDVKACVTYKLSGEEKNIEISTLITKD